MQLVTRELLDATLHHANAQGNETFPATSDTRELIFRTVLFGELFTNELLAYSCYFCKHVH